MHLREPFFLRGRRSVIQRAVLMTVVLGGLTAIASWIIAIAYFAVMPAMLSLGFGPDVRPLPLAVIPPLVLATLIYRPLNRWNQSSPRADCVVLGCSGLLLVSGFVYSGTIPGWGELTPLCWSINLTGVVVLNGLYLRRNTRLHWSAFCMSLALTPLPVAFTFWLDNPRRFTAFGFASETSILLTFAAYSSSWLGVMTIPWGIPFWWPPEQTRPDFTQSPGQPPTAP